MTTRLHALRDAGTSPWLDYIDRTMLGNGELARRIRDDALMGMTSNPTIFEKALAEGQAYDAELASLPASLTDRQCFERLATTDVQRACDAFAGVYADSARIDGYVSLEVGPDLAHDAAGTIAEARALWAAVNRPNLMIKVPGTVAGAEAVQTLIADGINVNVTLLFSVDAHARVIEAYLAGLEARAAAGGALDHVASVASFFVSRVDSAVDAQLGTLAANATDAAQTDALRALQGRTAIANAKRAYALFAERFAGARWDALAARGAQVQRPLWASTSTKNPAYRDVIYVEALIGPHTVNTLPPATLDAFRDHGETARTVDAAPEAAEAHLAALANAGIRLDAVTDQLLAEGLASFAKSFDTLLAGLAAKRAALGAGASA
ncbi:MAG TPA: transaldolase [Gemmatimonadaceae bacterium]|nr:transaldolase [Gemmatimonadaceae bacterium]